VWLSGPGAEAILGLGVVRGPGAEIFQVFSSIYQILWKNMKKNFGPGSLGLGQAQKLAQRLAPEPQAPKFVHTANNIR
jgi:hypothetical protein